MPTDRDQTFEGVVCSIAEFLEELSRDGSRLRHSDERLGACTSCELEGRSYIEDLPIDHT